MVFYWRVKATVTILSYDAPNRPTGKSYLNCPATAAVTYTCDVGANGKGRRTSMADASGFTAWLYDSRGRVVKETKVISGSSFVTEWTYNSADLPVTMKYPDGEIVTTAYDNRMLPISVTGTDNYVPSMTYDSAGRLLTRALGNGLTQTYTYYPWNQQGGRLHTLVTGALQNMTYQYDSVGNITQIANSVAGETSVYDYDALDRLTSWQLNQDSPETYTYDAQGNLDVKNGLNLNYNDAAHKHAVTHIGSTQKYWYDEGGNQVTRIVGADTFDLAYDAENRLVEVKKNNVTISQFTYDGDGQRVKSVMDGETILFVGGYYERKGSQITKYYMAGATRVAMRKYTIPQNMTVEYLLGDHLGSTSLTTDAAGAKVSEMRYKPWGETRYTWTNAPANTSPAYELVKYQFTGQYSYDAEFGLKFYNARWLDPVTGRFAQADTLVPTSTQGTQAWDRYAYVNNNPIRSTDPTGHLCEDEDLDGHCPGSEETTPPPATSITGTYYIVFYITTAAEAANANLSTAAEESYVYGPEPSLGSLLDSIAEGSSMYSDFHPDIPYYPITLSADVTSGENGTTINNLNATNGSPTYLEITQVTFNNNFAIRGPSVAVGLSSEINMEVNYSVPAAGVAMQVMMVSHGGFPPRASAVMIISSNVFPACMTYTGLTLSSPTSIGTR